MEPKIRPKIPRLTVLAAFPLDHIRVLTNEPLSYLPSHMHCLLAMEFSI